MIACKGHQVFNPDCVTCVLKNDTSIIRQRKQAAEYFAKSKSESEPKHIRRDKSTPRKLSDSTKVVELTCNPSFVWRLLHRMAWVTPNWNPKEVEQRYIKWKKLIPRYGCSCTAKWRELETKYPPPFNDREKFFEWTVLRHNDVNDRLREEQGGHPNFSLEEAYKQYKREPSGLSKTKDI